MPLREHFGTSGNWLFRWRSYLPLVLFVPVLAVMSRATVSGGGRAEERLCVLAMGAGIQNLLVQLAPEGLAAVPDRQCGQPEGHERQCVIHLVAAADFEAVQLFVAALELLDRLTHGSAEPERAPHGPVRGRVPIVCYGYLAFTAGKYPAGVGVLSGTGLNAVAT